MTTDDRSPQENTVIPLSASHDNYDFHAFFYPSAAGTAVISLVFAFGGWSLNTTDDH